MLKKSFFNNILLYSSTFALFFPVILYTTMKLNVQNFLLYMLITSIITLYLHNLLLIKKLSKKSHIKTKLISKYCDLCPDILLFKDTHLKYEIINRSFINMLNLDPMKDYKGCSTFDILQENEAKIIDHYDKKAISDGTIQKFSLTINNNIVLNISSSPIKIDGKFIGILTLARDITKIANLQKELIYKKQEVTTILNSMPIISILKDSDGNYLSANSKLYDILGQKNLDIRNIPHDYYGYAFKQEVKKEDDIIRRTKQSYTFEKQIKFGNQEKRWYRLVKVPILDDFQNIKKIAVFLRDVTIEKKVEAQKENFISTLTHDLKNPTLAQIRALELLINDTFGKLTPDQHEIITHTLNSCKYMLNMILTILHTYKFDAGIVKLNYSKFDAIEVTKKIIAEYLFMAKDKNQKIKIYSNYESIFLQADEMQITRVITNLLSNSIYYGFINSEIKIFIDRTKNHKLVFKIENSSKYIPLNILKNIFNKYSNDENDTFHKNSTGIGLYLSKQIISAHSGEMIADSSLSNITTFGFILNCYPEYRDFSPDFYQRYNCNNRTIEKLNI